tara:strand:- start:1189 stop:1743 length:555 start_codon:yes stop_codon:yes gene_type:complete
MNKLNKKIILVFISLTLFFGVNSNAETSYPNTSIGIIDYNLVLLESKAGINATKQFEAIRKKTEDDIIKSDKEIIEEKNKLIEQQSIIAPEAFDLKRIDFEKKFQKHQADKQDKYRKLDTLVQSATNEILKYVNPILEDLSKDLGITVILEKNSVVLSAVSMDLTEQVIKILNKELPKIKVTLD